MRKTAALCFLTLLISCAVCELPGVNFAIKFDSVENLKNKVLPGVLSKVKGTNLGDKTVTYKTYFSCTYKNIIIDDFELTPENIDLQFPMENVGELLVEGMNLTLKYDYEYKLLFTKGSGTGNYKFGNASMAIAVQAVKDGDFFALMMSSANAQLGSVSTHMDGKGVFPSMINYLSDHLNSILNPIATVELMMATFLIGQPALTKFAQEFPTKEPIGKTGVTVDYGLIRESFAEDRYEFGMKGKFYETSKPYDPQPVQEPFYMPWYDESLGDAQFFVSPSSINSALWSFWKTGGLKFTLTDSMLPKKFPLRLNTHDLDSVFPGLKDQFGDNIPCTITAYPSTYPTVAIKDGQITLSYDGGLLTTVLQGSNNSVDALDLAANFDVVVSVTTKDKKIYPNFDTVSLKGVKVNRSQIPHLDIFKVSQNLQTVTAAVTKAVNQSVFAKGLDLPTIGGVDFTNPSVTVPGEYAVVAGTPDFSKLTENIAEVVVKIFEQQFHGAVDSAFGLKSNDDSIDFSNLLQQ
eukprot:CAMPEP_0114997680 /NCGR_PEP_ID=MMETSP0216-20121206/15044_1 /TAXON_ID=223996 /ORGANISM="Protocruzia adherens, Strain Boccale" /LENGTH=519 /DNA_ID=CAMNT_0002362109 /DNA_START=163 /DNA_END=1722 /DNA_ORIENTATION=+